MYYFVSDVHLGAGSPGVNRAQEAREVERRFVEWLREVGQDAQGIFLLGDIFDFWFEYDYVVPKGFVRVLGEIARLTDRGVRVVFMTGNHDMWVGNYLSLECGVELYTAPRVFTLNGRKVHIAHGDNLNIKDNAKLKMLNSLFRSQGVRKLFSTLVHPNLAMRFGLWWSGQSRGKRSHSTPDSATINRWLGSLIAYAEMVQHNSPCDYYMYGHLHQKLHHKGDGFEVLFVNDWSCDPHCITLNEEGVASIQKI